MQVDSSQIQSDTDSANEIIQSYLQDNLEMLLRTMRLFVKNANIAGSQGIEFQSEELLGTVMTIALQKAKMFDSSKPPKAWILGIAANVVLQEQRRVFGRNRREVSIDDYAAEDGTLGWWIGLNSPSPEPQVLAQANVEHMLSLVSGEDREILELVILKEMNSTAVAATLGIKLGTARVRLFRALQRIRKALEAQGESEGKH